MPNQLSLMLVRLLLLLGYLLSRVTTLCISVGAKLILDLGLTSPLGYVCSEGRVGNDCLKLRLKLGLIWLTCVWSQDL
jgi:hypothetical protein